MGRIEDLEITRIDFMLVDGQWKVNKLAFNPEFDRTIMVSGELKPADFDLNKALEWLLSKGWDVIEWETGARAWKYGKKPVRTAGAIKRLRDQMREDLMAGHAASYLPENSFQYDLRYYF